MRVTARIAFDSGQRMTSEAVIFLLDSGVEPYRILTWRDDIDDAPRGPCGAAMSLSGIMAWLKRLDRHGRGRCPPACTPLGARAGVFASPRTKTAPS